jgi:hypothetical protein
MIKIYTAALAVATALNVFYTVYSYNEVNKWRQAMDSRIENTVERVNHIEDRSISISESVEKTNAQIKNEQQIAYKSQDSIVKSMMLLESRVYELEENKLKEQQ